MKNERITMKKLPSLAGHIDITSTEDGIIAIRCKVKGITFTAQYDDVNVGVYGWNVPDEDIRSLFNLLNLLPEPCTGK